MTSSIRPMTLALLAALGLLAAACGADDGATVRDLGAEDDSTTEGDSASTPVSGSASASAPADGGAAPAASTVGDGGYEYASNVDAHRLVVADICAIAESLDTADFATAATIYRDGVYSVNSDGSVRSIGGFAARDDRSHGLDAFYQTPAPLDEFVIAALEGTGVFADQPDAVRVQGAEKGIQNQTMIAWVVHELNSAISKAEEGNFDVAEGAVHNWDEGWAFFHGSEPSCAPYATGDKRAANFGTVAANGTTAVANEAILAAMVAGRDALLAEDVDGAKAAAAEVVKNVVITYSQATIRYASLIEDDLANDDEETAKVHQAEGFAFWRVIEGLPGLGQADAATINAILDIGNEPGANGFGDDVRTALQPAFDELGITAEDIGELG